MPWGTGLWTRATPSWRGFVSAARRLALHARPHAALGAILLVAFLLRIANLFPGFYYGDDAEYATVARSLAADPRNLAYPDLEAFGPAPFVSQPPFLLYLFALGVALTGDASVGPVLVSVLLGTATCAVVYAVGVRLDGRLVGSLAAAFLAVLPFHVSVSRKATLDAGLTFLFALTIWLFLEWHRRPMSGRAAAVGAAAGAAVLAKLYGFLVLGPIVVGLACVAWAGRRASVAAPLGDSAFLDLPAPPPAQVGRPDLPPPSRPAWSRRWAWPVAPPFFLGFAYLSLLWYLRASRNLWDKLVWQVERVGGTRAEAEGSGSVGTPHDWHWYLTDGEFGVAGQVGPVLYGLSLVGVAFLAYRGWRERDRRVAAWTVAAWPLVILGFFTLSSRKEWFYILPALPALVVAAAVSLVVAGRWFVAKRRPSVAAERRVYAATMALLIVIAGLGVAGQAQASLQVFVGQASPYGFGVKEAAEWIEAEDPSAAQIGTLLGRFSLHYYNGQPTYHWYVPHEFVDAEIEAGRARFLVWDSYLIVDFQERWFEELRQRHDAFLVHEVRNTEGDAVVRVYEFGRA